MSKSFIEKKFDTPGVTFMRVNSGEKGKGSYLWKVKVWEVLHQHGDHYDRIGQEYDVKMLTNIKKYRADNFIEYVPINADTPGVRDFTNRLKDIVAELGLKFSDTRSPLNITKRVIDLASDTSTHSIPDLLLAEWGNEIERIFAGKATLKRDRRKDFYHTNQGMGSFTVMYVGPIGQPQKIAGKPQWKWIPWKEKLAALLAEQSA